MLEIIECYDNWKKLYPLSENVTRNYYQYRYRAECSQQYKYVKMDHIGEITIDLYSVDKYKECGNFFENLDEMVLYIEEQLRKGNQEVIVYFNFLDNFDLEFERPNDTTYLAEHLYVDTEYRSFNSLNMIRITPYVEE